jgi:hypothetical protein
MKLKETESDDGDWIHVVQDKLQWRTTWQYNLDFKGEKFLE